MATDKTSIMNPMGADITPPRIDEFNYDKNSTSSIALTHGDRQQSEVDEFASGKFELNNEESKDSSPAPSVHNSAKYSHFISYMPKSDVSPQKGRITTSAELLKKKATFLKKNTVRKSVAKEI
jgi:hypothetical protein